MTAAHIGCLVAALFCSYGAGQYSMKDDKNCNQGIYFVASIIFLCLGVIK